MSGIRQWLKGLGLAEFADAFEAERIDLAAAQHLSDADLKELGLPMGPRRKLLAALSEAAEGAAGRLGAEPAAAQARAVANEAERRQLTVMFCDLVGSTALSGQLDPEDYREVITSYQRAATDAVRRFDGHVAKYLGDGLLAYFGYPQAHEDDAERAVRSGLASLDAVRELTPRHDISLDARVGIATGLVVVGDISDEGVSEQGAISGETPNLAARLQGVAEPGSVVIGERTRRLVGDLFKCEDLGPQDLKGIGEPVAAYRVTGERAAASRFEARHAGAITQFVGREMELQTLLHRWARAKDGEGQVVLISGEPGIGKSRLTERLHEQLSQEQHVRVLCQCSPHHTNSALYPVITQLTFAAGVSADDPAAIRLDKLEDMLAQATDDVDSAAPLIADLLSIPTDDRYPPLNLTPQAQKARTLDALNDQIVGLAAKQPVLVVFEDLHWIDPTTQELLDLMLERIESARVLALFTFRPEYEAHWVGQPHVTLMALSRLGRHESIELVRNVAAETEIDVQTLEEVAGKADGVPLFVEELTRAVMEGGAPDAIPTTIQASLLARFDRLGPAKEVAQLGAVIGREFGYLLLAAVSDLDEATMDERLTALTESQLVYARGSPPDATYTFKHALVQDAAYGSLLKTRCKALHARVAGVLEEESSDTVETQPELLAHHYTEAGSAERAIVYWQRAGEHAGRRSANPEAISHLTRALELLRGLPETPERARLELDLHLGLGPALMLTKGLAAPEVERIYLRARELCLQVGETERLFTVTWGLWLNRLQRGQSAKAASLAKELLELAERQADPALLLQGHHAAWTTDLITGELSSCREHAERGIALYDIEKHRSHAIWYGGHDPGVCAQIHAGTALWFLGYPDQALQRAEGAVSLARQLAHGFSTILSILHLSHTVQLRGEFRRVQQEAEAVAALSVEENNAQYLAAGTIMRGWAIAAKGESETGIAEMRSGLLAYEATGARARRSYYLSLLADAYRRTSRVSDGLDTLAEALDITERLGEHRWEAELHRLKGELLVQRASVSEAERCFTLAIDVARQQSTKSLELRAATGLARLWRDQAKRNEACDLLSPIYNWFTEGFDTPDLMEAKALLEGLG